MVNQNLMGPNNEDKLWAGLSYAGCIFFAIPSVIIFALKKGESDFIKFHALQATFLEIVMLVIGFALGILGSIPIIGLLSGLVGLLIMLAFLGIWIFLMIQSFTGKTFKIPVLGDFIEKSLMN